MKETVDSSDLSHPQQAWRGGLKEGGWGPADVIELISSNKDVEMSVCQPASMFKVGIKVHMTCAQLFILRSYYADIFKYMHN